MRSSANSVNATEPATSFRVCSIIPSGNSLGLNLPVTLTASVLHDAAASATCLIVIGQHDSQM